VDAKALQRIQLGIGLERLTGLVRNQAWRDSGGVSLHPAQRALLATLASEGGSMRPGELAARLGVSAASISDSIRAIEAKGWIVRAQDPDDARARRLSLTGAGAELIAGIQRADGGLAQLLRALTDQDAAALLRILQLLVHQAQAQGLASGMRTCLGCVYFRPYANAANEAGQPHFCAFIGTPFGDAELRADCAEQTPQPDATVLAENVKRFREGLAS
jgi:DNA-binding MarR family transcriptional regulator